MILLRHGQSEFNLHFGRTRQDPGIEDPPLTALGRQQAEEAAVALAGQGLRRIVVSPYTRALQTAAPVARALDLPVEVAAEVRERFAFACDVGSTRGALALAWPQHDFASIDETWWPAAEESFSAIGDRAERFRRALRESGRDAETLVVTHWGFILALTGQRVENGVWLRLAA